MIKVNVHMHGNLRRFLPDGIASMIIDVPDGTRVADLAETLKARDDVWLASINKDVVPMSATLTEGASLDFFPILEGG